MKKNKEFKCDSCKKITTDPYSGYAKEFYIKTHYGNLSEWFENKKRIRKICLCNTCFNALNIIANQMEANI